MKINLIVRRISARILIIIGILTIFTFISCEDDTNMNSIEVDNNNYYVKYVISSQYPRLFSNWSVSVPKGGYYTKNNYQTRYWEQTFGPVKKGFLCEVKVANGEPTIKIFVSKNDEPFALNESVVGNKASYIVNNF